MIPLIGAAGEVCYGRIVDLSTGEVLAEVTNPPTSTAAALRVFPWLILTAISVATLTVVCH